MTTITCPTCGTAVRHDCPGQVPPEPPRGTWVRDKYGAISQRRVDGSGVDGWGQPGFFSTGRWEAMWLARGPLTICGPWGAPLDTEVTTYSNGDQEVTLPIPKT